ncbi:hypothetical protein [Flavobacterium pedocola]
MDIENYNLLLKKPIKSENGVLVFTFSFSNSENGIVNAYDKLLEVNISTTWNFVKTGDNLLIAIQGFDILKFGRKGLICDINELERELKCLESAYDLCFGS